ncbi:MAG: potassium channel family protein [Candidatus Heteroscillospira sp.]
MKRVKKQDGEIFGVIGLGRFGSALAVSLAEAGLEVVAVDRDEAAVRRVRDKVEQAFVCDELTTANLLEAGIQDCDVVVVCIGSLIDVSVLTTLRVVSMGVKRVISKAINKEHGEILEKIGAEVVYPEHDMALRLAQRLSANSVIEYISLSVDMEIAEFEAEGELIGKTVMDLELRRRFGLNIIAIQHGGRTTIAVDPHYRFEPGDVLVVIGDGSDMARFKDSY